MKLIKTNSVKSSVYAELELSTDELETLISAISYIFKNLSDSDISEKFGDDFELQELQEGMQNSLIKCEKLIPELMPKAQLEKYVSKFRTWLSDNYNEEQIKEINFDDTGYPYWGAIESYFTELITKKQLKQLDKEDRKNLLYLIARNWDTGTMISWLSQLKPLSWCGNLTENDFIELAKVVVELEHIEYEDAKAQFISSFKKFDTLTLEIEKILLTAYKTGGEYIKRLSLMSLAKLHYPDIRGLIKLSWETEDSEHHRMGCLSAINEYLEDEDLLKEYVEKASKDDRKYIRVYVEKIKLERKLK